MWCCSSNRWQICFHFRHIQTRKISCILDEHCRSRTSNICRHIHHSFFWGCKHERLWTEKKLSSLMSSTLLEVFIVVDYNLLIILYYHNPPPQISSFSTLWLLIQRTVRLIKTHSSPLEKPQAFIYSLLSMRRSLLFPHLVAYFSLPVIAPNAGPSFQHPFDK